MRRSGLLIVCCLAAAAAAQVPPHFDAISIKVLRSGTNPQISSSHTPGRLRYDSIALEGLVRYAYDLRAYQPVTGGPAWAHSQFGGLAAEFQVEATFPADTTPAAVRSMMQAALADRFQLVVHRVSKQGNVFNLVVAPGGPKLTESKPDAPPLPPRKCPAEYSPCISVHGADATIASLADGLSTFAGRPVLDKTGLTAHYNYIFFYTITDPALLETLRASNPNLQPNDTAPALPGRDATTGLNHEDSVRPPDARRPRPHRPENTPVPRENSGARARRSAIATADASGREPR